MDKPNPIISEGCTITIKPWHCQEDPETGCPVHDAEWRALQKWLLTALLEVCRRRRSQVCSRRGSRGYLRWSHGSKVPRKKDHESRLFLAHNVTRRSRFHQEMWQLPKVWKHPASPRREDDDHYFTLAIYTMGDWHHGASTTRKEASKVLTHRYQLLYEVGGGKSTSHDHRSKGTKFCMEKYCMQVQDPTDNHLG